MNVLVPLVPSSCGVVVVSPPNDPVSEYVPLGSVGVTEQVATPLALVVPVHVCVPFTVKVTGSLGTGWLVVVFVSVPDTGVDPL